VRPNVELHVGELVLHGLSPRDRAGVGETFEREMARLFAEQGNPLGRRGYVGRLDGGSFETKPDSTPEAIGIQIARATYRSLGQ